MLFHISSWVYDWSVAGYHRVVCKLEQKDFINELTVSFLLKPWVYAGKNIKVCDKTTEVDDELHTSNVSRRTNNRKYLRDQIINQSLGTKLGIWMAIQAYFDLK